MPTPRPRFPRFPRFPRLRHVSIAVLACLLLPPWGTARAEAEAEAGADAAAWLERASVEARRVTGRGPELTPALQVKGELLAAVAARQAALGLESEADRNRQIVRLCRRALAHDGEDGWVVAAEAWAKAAVGDDAAAQRALAEVANPAERVWAEAWLDGGAADGFPDDSTLDDVSPGFRRQVLRKLDTHAIARRAGFAAGREDPSRNTPPPGDDPARRAFFALGVAEARLAPPATAVAVAEPVVEPEPVVEAEPRVEAAPPAVAEPVVEADPAVEVEPVAAAEPLVEAETLPAVEAQPVVEAESAAEAESPAVVVPMAEVPPASEDSEPVVEIEPVVEPAPRVAADPVVEAEPATQTLAEAPPPVAVEIEPAEAATAAAAELAEAIEAADVAPPNQPVERVEPTESLEMVEAPASPEPALAEPVVPAEPPAEAAVAVAPPELPEALPPDLLPELPPVVQDLRRLSDPAAVLDDTPAPAVYDVEVVTTKGVFTVRVTRAWAPAAADRFHDLAQSGYYHNQRFFRVVEGFVVQWGIHGFPRVAEAWRPLTFPDEPRRRPNVRGTIAFAAADVADSRNTQVFVNLGDHAFLDELGFVPFGRVTAGLDVVESLFAGHGDAPSRQQPRIQREGNAFLDATYPKLDSVVSVSVTPAAE